MCAKFNPSLFTATEAKPLPVILLLDVSSSMSGEKIGALNSATKAMIETFRKESSEIAISVAMITFGNEVKLHLPYTKAKEIEWQDLIANGYTPMGTALRMAKAMIEDKETTPSRAYRPSVVLVSDGEPTDEWQAPMSAFINEGRSQKCDRFAMAIGSDANESVLEEFIRGTERTLFKANDAVRVSDFFEYVTMSVTSRTKSQDPNVIVSLPPPSSSSSSASIFFD